MEKSTVALKAVNGMTNRGGKAASWLKQHIYSVHALMSGVLSVDDQIQFPYRKMVSKRDIIQSLEPGTYQLEAVCSIIS